MHMFLFFVFQPKHGIRDGHVTGVQTCALPIYLNPNCPTCQKHHFPSLEKRAENPETVLCGRNTVQIHEKKEMNLSRSEERRVGKEWRDRWATRYLNRNKEVSPTGGSDVQSTLH